MPQLNDQERRAWLRLSRTEQVGPVTFHNLIARFGSASAALENLPRMAARVVGAWAWKPLLAPRWALSPPLVPCGLTPA